MALFDWFIPKPAVNCPRCGTPLHGWQGKDGVPRLTVWEQGRSFPVDQRMDDQHKASAENLRNLRLPDSFWIYGGHCDCGYHPPFAFEGITENGVWTRLDPAPEILQLKNVGDGHFQCPECFDIVEAKEGWRLVLCPTCKAERWLEQKVPVGRVPDSA